MLPDYREQSSTKCERLRGIWEMYLIELLLMFRAEAKDLHEPYEKGDFRKEIERNKDFYLTKKYPKGFDLDKEFYVIMERLKKAGKDPATEFRWFRI
jgi:hypothetical protein